LITRNYGVSVIKLSYHRTYGNVDYTSTLSEFAFKNKGLYTVFIATMLTHPLEKSSPTYSGKTLAATSSGLGKICALQKYRDYYRSMDGDSGGL
jgi:hypothetical protein